MAETTSNRNFWNIALNVNKELEVIYLSLEEGEVLRDMRDDWGPEDVAEFGLEFNQLLELREFVLDQDYSQNLGFKSLLASIFDPEFRASLNQEEAQILSSLEENSDFTNLAIAMGALVSGDFQSVKEYILDEFLFDEIDGLASAKEFKKQLRESFKKWQSSDKPQALVSQLPDLAVLELSKLRDLRG